MGNLNLSPTNPKSFRLSNKRLKRTTKPVAFADRVAEFILSLDLVPPGSQILVAVSGGPDSCALFFSLLQNRQRLKIKRLAAIYVDHGFRPEGPAETAFVRKLALDNGAEFFTGQLHLSHGSADEERARQGRYALFEKVAREEHFDLVALAHHADDMAETLLINLTRGSGPLGIKGMPVKRGLYIRPLLQERRADILAYCQQLGLTPLTDPTNLHEDYLRNRLRLTLLPLWSQLAGREITPILNRNATILAADEDLLASLTSDTFNKLLVNQQPLTLDRLSYLALHEALQRRVARVAIGTALGRYYQPSFAQVEEFIKVAKAGRGRLWLPENLELRATMEQLLIVSRATELAVKSQEEVLLITNYGQYQIGNHRLFIRETVVEDPTALDQQVAVAFSREQLIWPLSVRVVKPADHMTLSGHRQAVRLSKIMSDLKIPANQRPRQLVLCDKNGQILWLIGHKRSAAARIAQKEVNSAVLVTIMES